MAKTRKHRLGHRQRRRHTRCKTRRGGLKWKWPSLDYLSKHSLATLRNLYNRFPKHKSRRSEEHRPLLTPKEKQQLEELQQAKSNVDFVQESQQRMNNYFDREQEKIANQTRESKKKLDEKIRMIDEENARKAAERLKEINQQIAEKREQNKQIPLTLIREIMSTENPIHA